MISTVIMFGNLRIYTGWLVIGAAVLLFVTTMVVHIVVMRKQNRLLRLAKQEATPTTSLSGHLNTPPSQQSQDSAITEQLTADDGTELLGGDGTELLGGDGTELLSPVVMQGDNKG